MGVIGRHVWGLHVGFDAFTQFGMGEFKAGGQGAQAFRLGMSPRSARWMVRSLNPLIVASCSCDQPFSRRSDFSPMRLALSVRLLQRWIRASTVCRPLQTPDNKLTMTGQEINKGRALPSL